MMGSPVRRLQRASSVRKTWANSAHLYLGHVHLEQEHQDLLVPPLERSLGDNHLSKERKPI